jgi:ABC-type amino acid transport substrate-binding protein
MKKRYMCLAAMAVAMGVVMAGCSSSSGGGSSSSSAGGGNAPGGAGLKLITGGQLTVATSLTNKPFAFIQNSAPAGFDMDLMAIVSKDLGLKIKYINTSFGSLVTDVVAGKADLAIQTVAISPARLEVVDFSKPYFFLASVLAVNSKRAPDLNSISALKGGDVVGVVQGSGVAAWAQTNLAPKGVTLKLFQDEASMAITLDAGSTDAALMDTSGFAVALAGDPTIKNVGTLSYGQGPGQLSGTGQLAMAVAKGNSALTSALSAEVDKIFSDGQFRALATKWFPSLSIAQILPPGVTVPSS